MHTSHERHDTKNREVLHFELIVTARNASLFLTPKSRILKRFGTERERERENAAMSYPLFIKMDSIHASPANKAASRNS